MREGGYEDMKGVKRKVEGAKWDPQPAIDCPTLKCTSFPIKKGRQKDVQQKRKRPGTWKSKMTFPISNALQ